MPDNNSVASSSGRSITVKATPYSNEDCRRRRGEVGVNNLPRVVTQLRADVQPLRPDVTTWLIAVLIGRDEVRSVLLPPPR